MSSDETLFNQILEQSKRPEFSSLVTVDENERQDIQEFVQELKQREEYYSNCDVEHLGRKLLDRDEMSFLTKQLTITCPHIPRFSQIIAAFDYVMPEPVQSTSYTDELYGKALKDLSYLIQDEFLFTQSEDYPLDNIVARSSDLESSSLSTVNDSARDSPQPLAQVPQKSLSETGGNQSMPSTDEDITQVSEQQIQQIDSAKIDAITPPMPSESAPQSEPYAPDNLPLTPEPLRPDESELAIDGTDSPSDLRTPVVVTEPESKILADAIVTDPAESADAATTSLTQNASNQDTIRDTEMPDDLEKTQSENLPLADEAPDAKLSEDVSMSPAVKTLDEDETQEPLGAGEVIAPVDEPIGAERVINVEAKTGADLATPEIPGMPTSSELATELESELPRGGEPAKQFTTTIPPEAAGAVTELQNQVTPTGGEGAVETQKVLSDPQPTVYQSEEPEGLAEDVREPETQDVTEQPVEEDAGGVYITAPEMQIAGKSQIDALVQGDDRPEEQPSRATPQAKRSEDPKQQQMKRIGEARSDLAGDGSHADDNIVTKKAADLADIGDSVTETKPEEKAEKTPSPRTAQKSAGEPKSTEQTTSPNSRGRTLTLFNGVGPEACASDGMDWRLEQILRRRAQMCLAEASNQVQEFDTPHLEVPQFEHTEEIDDGSRAITARLPRRSGSYAIQRAESCPPDWCREVFEKAEKRRYQRSSSETRRHWNPLICADMTSEWRRDRLRKATNRKASPNFNESPNGPGLYQFDSHLQEVYDKIKSRRLKKTLVQDEGYQLSKQVPDREDLRIAGPKSPPAHLLSRVDSSGPNSSTNLSVESPARETGKDDGETADGDSRATSGAASAQVSPPRILVSPTRAAAALAVLQGSAPVIPSFNGDIATAPSKSSGTGAPRRKPKPVLVAATATTESSSNSPEIKDFRNILKKTGRLETVLKKSAGAGAVRQPEGFEDSTGNNSGPGGAGQTVIGEKRAQLIQDQPVRPSDVRALFEKKARENDASGADEKEWWLKQVHKYNKR